LQFQKKKNISLFILVFILILKNNFHLFKKPSEQSRNLHISLADKSHLNSNAGDDTSNNSGITHSPSKNSAHSGSAEKKEEHGNFNTQAIQANEVFNTINDGKFHLRIHITMTWLKIDWFLSLLLLVVLLFIRNKRKVENERLSGGATKRIIE